VFATVVNVVPPALTFTAGAVSLGIGFSILFRKVAMASLFASALVAAVFIAFGRHISSDFSVYAKDMIFEPLIRDHFIRNPIEGFASAVFHFGFPFLIVAVSMRFRAPKRNEKKA
jgi:hypothetical protein